MLTMADPLLLYSVNTWLAFAIAERFYNKEHYVWCAPVFDATSTPGLPWHIPPTSSPAAVYKSLRQEVLAGDRHSAKIEQNKIGILRGAALKRAAGVIASEHETQIAEIVDASETADFKPLIFVIPYAGVASLIHEVPIRDRAHPLSSEYIIDALPRPLFDVLEGL